MIIHQIQTWKDSNNATQSKSLQLGAHVNPWKPLRWRVRNRNWLCSSRGCSTCSSHTPPHDMSPGSWPRGFSSRTTLDYSSRRKAGNGGINSKWGVKLHFLSSHSHRIKHLHNKSSSEFSDELQNKWPKYHCWSSLKPSNRCFSTDSNLVFILLYQNCPLQHFQTVTTVTRIFPQSNSKTSTWHVAWVSPLKTANTRAEDTSKPHQNSDIYKRNLGPVW